MAEKVSAPKSRRSRNGADAAIEDLSLMLPDQTVTVNGERLTVREFRAREGLEVKVQARQFLKDLRALSAEDSSEVTLDLLSDITGRHGGIWIEMIARACDRDAAWVGALPDMEWEKLQEAFWYANVRFFLKEMWRGVVAEAALAGLSSGRKSSPISSAPASDETPPTSRTDSPSGKSNASLN